FIGASERFAPAAVIPVLDVAASLAELERVARRGFRAALLPAHIDTRPYNDAAYDPLWAAAQDLGIPLTFHAGTGRSQTPAHGPAGLANIPFTGDRCLLWGSDYPHPEGTWPNSQEVLARQFAGVAAEAMERIVCRNAAELYRFRLPTC